MVFVSNSPCRATCNPSSVSQPLWSVQKLPSTQESLTFSQSKPRQGGQPFAGGRDRSVFVAPSRLGRISLGLTPCGLPVRPAGPAPVCLVPYGFFPAPFSSLLRSRLEAFLRSQWPAGFWHVCVISISCVRSPCFLSHVSRASLPGLLQPHSLLAAAPNKHQPWLSSSRTSSSRTCSV